MSIYTCAAITLSGAEGEILRTIRHGRMPEPKKVTIRQWLKDEVAALLVRQQNVKIPVSGRRCVTLISETGKSTKQPSELGNPSQHHYEHLNECKL